MSGDGLSNKVYLSQLRRLHGELVAMQEWVKRSGAKVCVVFEGRDTAGKGGTIKAITERVSPRVFRVVALQAPTERERSPMYIRRYLPHLPAAGEWKLSELDVLSYTRWTDYALARDDMFRATDTAWAPWYLVSSDDK